MNLSFQILLLLHIVAGSIALGTGLINIFRKKGDNKHRIVGKLFFFSMLTVSFSSLIMSYIHPNYFLFMIGIFTFYMVSSGQFYIIKKKRNWHVKTQMALTGFLLLFSIIFVSIGSYGLMKSNLFAFVFITFGSLGFVYVVQDIKFLHNKSNIQKITIAHHLQRMTGAFIAALTAFLVVNTNQFPAPIPGFVYWLFPTLVLTPIIIKWSSKFAVDKSKV